MPPLSALRAFDAYAQAGSATGAGAMLNVSHAAISQQIKALERWVGVGLVSREGRSLTLTTQGRLLADALGRGFGEIGETISYLTDAESARPLRITTTPNFAANWLMPRLADFTAQHPDHEILINPTPDLAEIGLGGFDVAIRYGNGDWPALNVTPLIDSNLAIVGARSLVGDLSISNPSDLLRTPWLQEVGSTEVSDWLAEHGVTDARIARTTYLPGNFIMDAVRKGQGIAAIARVFAETEIADGRIRVLFESTDRGTGYFTVTAKNNAMHPAAHDFMRWLQRQSETTPPWGQA